MYRFVKTGMCCLPALIALGLSMTPHPAQADVRYTTVTILGGSDAAKPGDKTNLPQPRSTTYIKNRRQRVETVIQIGPKVLNMTMNMVTLTLCDKHQMIQMDPALKIYTVAPMGEMPWMGMMATGGAPHAMPEGKPGTGKVVSTYTIQDLGTEKVADLTTHHYSLTVHVQSSGCAGNSDNTTKMEDWVAPIKGGLDCPERVAPTHTIPNENGCQITYVTQGDVAALRSIFSGMIARMKVYEGDQVTLTQELRDYSTAQLDDALFSPPADFKQVSSQEYAQAERDAMVKAMTGGGGAAPDQGAQQGDQSAPPPDDGKKKDDKKHHGGFHVPGLPF